MFFCFFFTTKLCLMHSSAFFKYAIYLIGRSFCYGNLLVKVLLHLNLQLQKEGSFYSQFTKMGWVFCMRQVPKSSLIMLINNITCSKNSSWICVIMQHFLYETLRSYIHVLYQLSIFFIQEVNFVLCKLCNTLTRVLKYDFLSIYNHHQTQLILSWNLVW